KAQEILSVRISCAFIVLCRKKCDYAPTGDNLMATILIVDDHLPHRLLFTTVLAKEGHRLIEANDGPEGLEKIRSEHPDLAIVDIPMPSMDGFQFVQKLREDPETAGLPVIFYSDSYNHREIEELAQHCGVTRVLRKDCDAKVILQNMRAVLEDSNRGTPAARDIWVMSIEEFQRSRQQLLSDKLLQREGQLEEASRQLQQLARQHELILNTIEQGIIGLDTSGQIGFANAAAALHIRGMSPTFPRLRDVEEFMTGVDVRR
ncbi:MAG: response regulator, partial [Candidatus Bathyarchaeia archaeon]